METIKKEEHLLQKEERLLQKKKHFFPKKDVWIDRIVYVALAIVFAALFLYGNYGGGGDSDSYLSMSITREPLYPLFLWVLRQIFGADQFYVQLAFIQNLLAFVATVCLVDYLGKKVFTRNAVVKTLGKAAGALFLVVPYVLTPLFSRSHLVMANKVMAEGITLPGYYFFVLFLLKIIYEEEKLLKHILCAGFLSALLVLARGQLMLTIIILAAVIFIKLILLKKYKQLYLPFITAIVLFAVTGLLTNLYHYCNSGFFTATASSKPMILANALYVAEAEDGADIEDADLKRIFEQTYQALDEKQMLYQYASGGIIDRAQHHESCHDDISFHYFEPIKNQVFENRMSDIYAEYMLFQDEVAAAITKELLVHNWSRYLTNYVNVCALGFVRSIAVDHPLLNWYALAAYGIGAFLLIFTWVKKGFTKEVFFFGTAYVMILGFVMATSLFLQCITRYMIYNFPLFYIAGMAVLLSWLPQKKK